MEGKVLVNEIPQLKPGARVSVDAEIRIKEKDHPYVSRGGLKIEAALDHWEADVTGRVILDVGASTGGFTDCVLQRGARLVHAVDVGYGQLDYRLRSDPRVVVWERLNIRNATASQFEPRPELAVMDVSFISILKVIPVLMEILAPGAVLYSLVKPQFEVGKGKVGKGGVVRDETLRAETVAAVIGAIRDLGATVDGPVESPITGPKGNVEYLIRVVFP